VDDEIRAYYEETGIERDRLTKGASRLEFARTKELLLRYLPPVPVSVLDVGGGPGAYAEWLAEAGHTVKLLDATPLHVEQARHRAAGRFVAEEGEAHDLAEPDDSYDVVLLFGPLYHLIERPDRVRALEEARRVLRPGGFVAVSAISRFASLLYNFAHELFDDRVWALVERDLADGRHLPGGDHAHFTTAYFHRPEELMAEIGDAGLVLGALFAVEGPGWIRGEALDDDFGFETAVRVARAVEREPTMIGASAHFLAVARST
jgi:SAM-dependent methyltransferase